MARRIYIFYGFKRGIQTTSRELKHLCTVIGGYYSYLTFVPNVLCDKYQYTYRMYVMYILYSL